VDVKALMRVALVYNIPMALNRATAEALIASFAEAGPPLSRVGEGQG
jgi:methylglyoxal synthase